MAVTVLDCDVITPGPYSLNWGAPGIKDVYVYILIYVYIYIFIYWGHRGSNHSYLAKMYIHFQVNYYQGIAIIVALELSFGSAFLYATYKKRRYCWF